MAVYTFNSGKGITVRIDYADVAGAYAGWFLMVVNGDNLEADTDSNPANGPTSYAALSTTPFWQEVQYGGGDRAVYPGPAAAWQSSGGSNALYRQPFLDLVHARLDRMFGAGHSATYTATIVQGITPAVVDDNW